ncbi:MAG: hypothetical protein K1X35_07655 [Caulobacteraceae bacterium]|nr:hypothetical protein [Caulobacteraceae bacterium]
MRLLALLAVAGTAVALAPAARAEIDRAAAARALAEADALCGARDLWRRSLCGPILIVDPATRQVVANRPGPGLTAAGGVFIGALPAELPVANTATDWNGRRWSMIMTGSLGDDPLDRAQLLMHESFHRIQAELGLPMRSPDIPYLSTTMGRAMLRLEWRALARALAAEDEGARLRAVADALAFRQFRRWTADGPEAERQLEINEGLAEYTGLKLSGRADKAAWVAARLARMERSDSYARSFAYGSGPAYGLLLDRYAPHWRDRIKGSDDLGLLLERAIGARRLGGEVDVTQAQARYGGEGIFREEYGRQAAREQAATAWTGRLVDGPVLRLPLRQAQTSFDPNAVFPLPPSGTVYPTLEVSDVWGVLKVDGGALVANDWSMVVVQAGAPGDVSGPGWSLQLRPGWRIARGERPGDFMLEPVR